MSQLQPQIPGNIPDGVIRSQTLDLTTLSQRLSANELFECVLTGVANENYGNLGPNLISCTLQAVEFPEGVSHFDVKDSIFIEGLVAKHFDRVFITQSAFRFVQFSNTTLRDTVFVDCSLDGVVFDQCDFSVTTFKSNVFRQCRFQNCITSNKLFEHCIFLDCDFENLVLQEGSILQNFGISLNRSQQLRLYRAETKESIQPGELTPRNQLEQVSLEFFLGHDLNESATLLDVVQFRLSDASARNVMHLATALKQLSSFLLALSNDGQILPVFPLFLFWSIDNLLESKNVDQLPGSVSEALELSAVRLRSVYEQLVAEIPIGEDSAYVLVEEGFTKGDLEQTLHSLELNIQVREFRRFNSPSVAELVSQENLDLMSFVVLVLATQFRLEVDKYQHRRKLLEFGTKLIGTNEASSSTAFQALLAVNIPRLVYVRLRAKINLSIISRLRRMVLQILDPEEAKRPRGPSTHA